MKIKLIQFGRCYKPSCGNISQGGKVKRLYFGPLRSAGKIITKENYILVFSKLGLIFDVSISKIQKLQKPAVNYKTRNA